MPDRAVRPKSPAVGPATCSKLGAKIRAQGHLKTRCFQWLEAKAMSSSKKIEWHSNACMHRNPGPVDLDINSKLEREFVRAAERTGHATPACIHRWARIKEYCLVSRIYGLEMTMSSAYSMNTQSPAVTLKAPYKITHEDVTETTTIILDDRM